MSSQVDNFNTRNKVLTSKLLRQGYRYHKIFDIRDDFNFDIVNFPFLDGDVPCSTSYGVYISQLECPVRSIILILVIKF